MIKRKRLTDTGKWCDAWFMPLSPAAKLLWLYLLDNCDIAGVVSLNVKLAAFQIGQPINEEHFIELGERLQRLDSGDFWIPKFIEFQFGTLNPSSLVHRSVIKAILGHGLNYSLPASCQGMDISCSSLNQVISMGSPSPKEKEKEKVKEKVKEKEGVQGEENNVHNPGSTRVNSHNLTGVEPRVGSHWVEPSVSVSNNEGPPLSPTLFEVQTTEKPVTLDKLQIRLGKLFGRRDTTVWKVDEIKAYKKIGKVDEDDLRALESMYYEKLPSGAPDYRRTTLITLLNNFSGELDKARNFKPQTCI